MKIDKIYTRGGDTGSTSLGDGSRVAKTHPRVHDMAVVEETNAAIGLARCLGLDPAIDADLARVQNDLFDLGADLCMPERDAPADYPPLWISEGQVVALEQAIDRLNADLQPLTSFILPGGTEAAARLHQARTLCRRAELACWSVAEATRLNDQVTIYLNRLSDYLFVAARWVNDRGRADVTWVPGAHR